MKGFKKDGKFRPTGNRKKSSLSKSDVDTRPVVQIKKYVPMEERKKQSLDPEEHREELAGELDKKFDEIITIDKGYSQVYGRNDEYYKVGVKDGMSSFDIDMIKEQLGYKIHEVTPANEYFVDVVFKKKESNS